MDAMRSYEVRTARTKEEVESLRGVWEQMRCHPNPDIDAFMIAVGTLPNVLMPYVLLLLENGQPQAILIGRVEEARIGFKLGFKTIQGPRLRQLVVIYRGLIGNASTPVADFFVSELNRRLKKKEIDSVWFYELQVQSEMYRAATTLPGFFTKDHGIKVNSHLKTALPANGIDELLKNISSKHRYWLKRLPKVLEKDFPGKVVYRRFAETHEVEQLAVDCERVARETYHRALGAGFKDNELWRQKLRLSATQQALRGYVLYIDGQPAAFWLGIRYRDTFYLDFTGYLPEYRKYELGTILFLKMIEDLIDSGVRELDYGLGTLWYKERFGGESWPEASVYIFAPTLKGIAVNMMRMGLGVLNRFGKLMLAKSKTLREIKTRWRNSLSADTPKGE